MVDKSCWTCNYQQLGGNTFIGKCKWFKEIKGEEPKDIPKHKVDVGCKLWKEKENVF